MRLRFIRPGFLLKFVVLAGAMCCVLNAAEILRSVRISVHDGNHNPIAGATIVLNINGATRPLTTNDQGEATVADLPVAGFKLSVSKDGFQPVSKQITPEAGASTVDLDVVLIPRLEKRETVVVQAPTSAEQTGSSPEEIARQQMKNAPSHPATVAEALPLLSDVLRGPQGIVVAGGDEKHSALLVNSVDMTDPATGQFGMTVPIDAVENLSVSTTPYLSQYGGFTGGVVSTVTRGGGEKWDFELNDPFPDFRIRSAHLRGMQSVSPHLNFGGPLIKQKLYLFDAAELVIDKTPVRTLPFPVNETKTTSENSFTQLDYVFSPSHTLTGTFHFAPQNTRYANLSFYNPQPVTPNIQMKSRALAFTDRVTLESGILQSTAAGEQFNAAVTPQAVGEMIVTPVGNQGDYFSDHRRESSRLEWLENYTFNPVKFRGTHNFQAGTIFSYSDDEGSFLARPVNIQALNGALLKRIEFTGGRPFSRTDFGIAGFVQDHWTLAQGLSLDGGVRLEQQRITGTTRLAPRMGFVWTPPVDQKKTIIRGGAGVFYDRVPLNVYAFQDYPREVITTFSPQGDVIDGPTTFLNVIASSMHHVHSVSRRNRAGNFAPYSVGSSVEVERAVTSRFKVLAKYSFRNSHGLVEVSPETLKNGRSALVERDSGNAAYRDFQVTANVGRDNGRKLFFTYARSSSFSDVNESNSYVGNLSFPVFRPDFFVRSSTDVPNRFIVWGDSALPWKMRVVPMMEYRTGFPFSVTDAYQNFPGIPNSTRFSSYFSLDARMMKDIPVNPKYTLRLSVRGLNLTNHFNAILAHSNTADPLFGSFFGNYGRRFKLDFDVLF